MNVLVKMTLFALLFSLNSNASVAKDSISFNGQLLDGALQREEAKEYGKYKPSQFAKKVQVVLVSWNSEEGKKRFFRSKYNNDFFQLAHHYQPQANPLYCGIASSVIVLNSIRAASGHIPNQPQFSIKKPAELGGDVIPYNLYSQASLLNEATDKVKSRQIIQLENISAKGGNNPEQFDPGLDLAELKGVLESYQLAVQKYPADLDIDPGVGMFRDRIKAVLSEKNQFTLINYKSDMVGQLGSGHISPLGAYDEQSDSVLILDVAEYQNPWLWVPLYDLYASMHTKDGESYRGYLIVEEGVDWASKKN
ncbi:MAG: phytochelatin synthase family protein [Gammaproteobacteria bacterium]|nr:phytochelatin synthase family protein [Gammaproteobacteria bacterium]